LVTAAAGWSSTRLTKQQLSQLGRASETILTELNVTAGSSAKLEIDADTIADGTAAPQPRSGGQLNVLKVQPTPAAKTGPSMSVVMRASAPSR